MKPGWVLTIALLTWIAVSDFILPIPAGCLEIMLLGTLVSGALMALTPASVSNWTVWSLSVAYFVVARDFYPEAVRHSIVAFAQIGALTCATLILPGFIWLVKAQRP